MDKAGYLVFWVLSQLQGSQSIKATYKTNTMLLKWVGGSGISLSSGMFLLSHNLITSKHNWNLFCVFFLGGKFG